MIRLVTPSPKATYRGFAIEVAEALLEDPSKAVPFHGTEGTAGNVRDRGTEWLRENETGLRLYVYRTGPVTDPRGRFGDWEAQAVTDMRRRST